MVAQPTGFTAARFKNCVACLLTSVNVGLIGHIVRRAENGTASVIDLKSGVRIA